MKNPVFIALRLTLCCMFLFVVLYPMLLLGIAQFAPNKGRGETVTKDGRVVGYALVGQSFTADKYFYSRPSAVNYNASGSGGSNKGPSNPEYLQQVRGRLDSFLVHNPGVEKGGVPVDLITASGSGLDPDISPRGAEVQVARVARVRGLSEGVVRDLVKRHTYIPFVGMPVVRLLGLNLDLERYGH